MKATDVLVSVENFIDALVNTRFIDEQELYEAVAKMATARTNRLAGLDPDRNR